MMKSILLWLTSLNTAYFIAAIFINQNYDVDNFFLLPFGMPAVIAFILFFAGIVTLINENKRYISLLLMVINGLIMLMPILLILFI